MSGLALLLSAGDVAYTIHKDAKEQSKNISLDVIRMLDEYDTTVKPAFGTGELLVRWQGVIANNGTVPIALVGHHLQKI